MQFCITYISKATKLMSETELAAVLKESISWNKDHGITGMLLYIQGELLHHKEGRFIQALEGRETDVRETFEKIRKDKRHFNVSVLNETPLVLRNFEDWTMGFQSLDVKEYLSLPARFELNEDFLKYKQADSLNSALEFIKQFYSLNLSFGQKKDTL
jgi:hypothetical protein